MKCRYICDLYCIYHFCKMKSFEVLSILFCVLAFANAKDDDVSSAEENLRELAKALNDKMNTTILLDIITMGDKIKEKCPDIEHKIETTMDRVGECVEDIELGSETFCSLIRKNFVRCTKPVRELVVGCMPQESKDIPPMVEKLVMAIIDEACSSTVEEMLELLNPCKMEKDPSTFPPCKEVITTMEQYKHKLPSKGLMCQMMPKMRTCIKAVLDASCPNTITKNIHMKMHDAMEKAVKDECDALNKA